MFDLLTVALFVVRSYWQQSLVIMIFSPCENDQMWKNCNVRWRKGVKCISVSVVLAGRQLMMRWLRSERKAGSRNAAVAGTITIRPLHDVWCRGGFMWLATFIGSSWSEPAMFWFGPPKNNSTWDNAREMPPVSLNEIRASKVNAARFWATECAFSEGKYFRLFEVTHHFRSSSR